MEVRFARDKNSSSLSHLSPSLLGRGQKRSLDDYRTIQFESCDHE